jgi:ATP-dependent RNA circularization protein (DNA/RNA ligase family)
MREEFFKYPSTPHIEIIGKGEIRGDKIMSEEEREEFLQNEITVEEKIDGANLGISFDRQGKLYAQSRGNYLDLPCGGQWKKLSTWLNSKVGNLSEVLKNRYVLFGEWCYAQHSIEYDFLPDWFLGFDIYDKVVKRFFSCAKRNDTFKKIGIFQTPKLGYGKYTIQELIKLMGKSKLGNRSAEGLYLRFDKGDWLIRRGKLVHPDFTQKIEQHWSRGGIKVNRKKAEILREESI